MSWQPFSLHFRQQYEGGYRYLDRCGQFMLAAVDALNFIPSETKPTGAKMEIPEHSFTANVDTAELIATQNMPESSHFFMETCIGLAELTEEHFKPSRIVKNGFAAKFFWPIPNADTLLATSLKFGSDHESELGVKLGLIPTHKRINSSFKSGSMELEVALFPTTLENVTTSRQMAGFRTTSVIKRRSERFNQAADRIKLAPTHALLLSVDLMEDDPPENSLAQHFKQMELYADTLKKEYSVR